MRRRKLIGRSTYQDGQLAKCPGQAYLASTGNISHQSRAGPCQITPADSRTCQTTNQGGLERLHNSRHGTQGSVSRKLQSKPSRKETAVKRPVGAEDTIRNLVEMTKLNALPWMHRLNIWTGNRV
ncbi:hypothetical protein J6590_084918 [Homalodisca vitripennis]|nr:hypothetical protein J6590_084918 [Homalodisca vitripennis]